VGDGGGGWWVEGWVEGWVDGWVEGLVEGWGGGVAKYRVTVLVIYVYLIIYGFYYVKYSNYIIRNNWLLMASAGSAAAAEPERGGEIVCRSNPDGGKFKRILRRSKQMPEKEIIPAIFNSLSVCGKVRVYNKHVKGSRSRFPKENECVILLGPHSGNYLNVKDMQIEKTISKSYLTYNVESFFYEAPLHDSVSQYHAFSSSEDAPFVLYHEIAEFLKNLLKQDTYDGFDIPRIIKELNDIITSAKTNHIATIRSDIVGTGGEFNPSTYLHKICNDGNTLLSSIMKQLLVQEKITEIPSSKTDRVACLSPNRVCTIDLNGDGYRDPTTDKHSQPSEQEYANIIFNILLKIKVVTDEHVFVIPLWFDRTKFKTQSRLLLSSRSDSTIDIFSSELLGHLLTSDVFMRETLPSLLSISTLNPSYLKSINLESIKMSLKGKPYSVVSCDIGCKSIWGFVNGNTCILFDGPVTSQGYVNPAGQIAMTVYDDSNKAVRHIVYHMDSRSLSSERSEHEINYLLEFSGPPESAAADSSVSPQPSETRPSLSPDTPYEHDSHLDKGANGKAAGDRVDVEVAPPPSSIDLSPIDGVDKCPKRDRSPETHELVSNPHLMASILNPVIVSNNKPFSHLESLLQTLWDIKDRVAGVANRLSLSDWWWSGEAAAAPLGGGRLRMARSLRKKPSFSKKKRGRSFGRLKTRCRRTRRTRRRRRIQKN
jgi:hypothetical protein